MQQRFKDLDRSVVVFRVTVGACIFLFFLLNVMTPYIADDFTYMFSFETGARMQGLADIIPSMVRHAYTMNGRIVPHALEQLFLLMPKLVYDVCSSAVFLWLLFSSYCVCNIGRERSALLFLAIFMAFWNYVPAFGQACLWQVGALNYMWALAFCMYYLQPYFTLYFGTSPVSFYRMPRSLPRKLLFTVLAFLFGSYSEFSSAVGIALSAGILLASPRDRRRSYRWLLIPIVSAVAGYIFMIIQPGESDSKSGLFSAVDILKRIPDVTVQMKTFLSVLFIAWAVLMTLSFARNVSASRRLASFGFFLGAIAGSYIVIFAYTYPYRCMITTTFFLILACGILLSELLDSPSGLFCRAALAVLTLSFAVNLICGVGDIGSAWHQYRQREAQINAALDAGETEITLSRIYYATKYSPYFEMKDLDRNYPDLWPNVYMAAYYGFDRIYGTDPVNAE